jgi:hypothetical protein
VLCAPLTTTGSVVICSCAGEHLATSTSLLPVSLLLATGQSRGLSRSCSRGPRNSASTRSLPTAPSTVQ